MGLVRDYLGTDSRGARWFNGGMSQRSHSRVSSVIGRSLEALLYGASRPRFPRAQIFALTLALAACGGGATVDGGVQAPDGGGVGPTATSLEDVDEPSPIDLDTTESSVDRGGEALATECVDVVITYLRALEALYPPVPQGADIGELMTEANIDWEEVGRVQAHLIEQGERLGCDLNREDEALFWEFVEIARREAPGMVDYLEWIAEQAASDEES
jgi:hypothetical protein